MSKKLILRATALFASVVMAAAVMAGCAPKEEKPSEPSSMAPVSQVTADKESAEKIDINGKTLSYWYPMWPNEAEHAQSMGDIPIYQEIEKRTGTHIDFISPPGADIAQAYTTLVATKDLPDIIQQEYWVQYPGGPDKAVEDGVYLKLNDLMAKYAPNYLNRISDPVVYKQAVTDTGTLYCFSMVDVVAQEPYYGPMYRADYLKAVGKEVPTTIDEVHDVLKAFKDELKLESPMLMGQNGYFNGSYMLLSAYDVSYTYYNDNGTIKFGPMEQGYRDYVTEMAKWYKEGLIDQEFPTKAGQDNDIVTDKTGMFEGNHWMPLTWKNQSVSSDVFETVAGPYPTLNKGDAPVRINMVNNNIQQNHTAVTSSCKEPEVAVTWLDWKYSDEGFLLCNYGIEGEGYTMVDGEPVYTEFFTENKNPKNYDYYNAQYYYLCGKGPYPRIWSREMFSFGDEAWDALHLWDESSTGEGIIPANITMTPEEGDAYNTLNADIQNWVNQQTVAFIVGEQEVNDDTWAAFTGRIKDMGVEEAIGYQQAAYDRYQKR